jgi:germination protein M
MKKLLLLLFLGLTFASMLSCNKNETASQPSQWGKVITTPAYEKYFGTAPPVDKGTAYAFVI